MALALPARIRSNIASPIRSSCMLVLYAAAEEPSSRRRGATARCRDFSLIPWCPHAGRFSGGRELGIDPGARSAGGFARRRAHVVPALERRSLEGLPPRAR